MSAFHYAGNSLCGEQIALSDIAHAYGTPTYVYSLAQLLTQLSRYQSLGPKYDICYSVKACSNIAILQKLDLHHTGFDVVSMGELHRVRKACGSAQQVVFSGVGKTAAELQFALAQNIKCFNIESIAELVTLHDMAKDLGHRVAVALRINPDIQADTHPYIMTGMRQSKFGMSEACIQKCLSILKSSDTLDLVGFACHIGSQISEIAPFKSAWRQLLALAQTTKADGFNIRSLNIGGGLGVSHAAGAITLSDYLGEIQRTFDDQDYQITLEPGRSLIADAGVLLTQVIRTKTHFRERFAIIDAGMNDFLRPALYQASHEVRPLMKSDQPKQSMQLVGPICETADVLGQQYVALSEGDYLAIMSAGAYGHSMSSNYNSRPKCAEVLIDGDKHYLIRKRESYDSLYQNEALC